MNRLISTIGILAISMSTFAQPSLAEKANKVSTFLSMHESRISNSDKNHLDSLFSQIRTTLQGYGELKANPFKLSVNNNTLTIFDRISGNKLYTWNNHDQMKRRGSIIALKDSRNELFVGRYQGGKLITLVEKWYDTVSFKITKNYVGIIDKDNIVEAYTTVGPKKKIIKNWKNTVKHVFDENFIALLDNQPERNFYIYNVYGEKIIQLKGVFNFKLIGFCLIEYAQDGQRKKLNIADYL